MEETTKPIMYISGKFSDADNLHGIEQNILTASRYALEAWEKGWAVICPHKNTSGFQHTSLPYNIWIDGDLSFIDRMDPKKGDVILMLPGYRDSKGAMMELKAAIKKGLVVHFVSTLEGVLPAMRWGKETDNSRTKIKYEDFLCGDFQ